MRDTLNTEGSTVKRVPLVRSSEVGPDFSVLYSHSLNHIEFISGIDGPG